jgi:formylglycine-generating enzyme required for sulfatase activity
MKYKPWLLVIVTVLAASLIAGTIIMLICRKKTETIDLGAGVKMDFVPIPAGSFLMGSGPDGGDEDEMPMHKVAIAKPFSIGTYEVTQEQWVSIMGTNPSSFKGAKLPVETVSWNECTRYLVKLGERTGRTFSLPTEAEWEYACRAGTTSRWSFGSSDEYAIDYAWIGSNSLGITHPVGGKKPNPWGLYDMHGNVWEWCADWYASPYPAGDVVEPKGPSSGNSRVLRGGGWGDPPGSIRSAYRNCIGPDTGHNGIGFRCVMQARNM